VCPVDHQALGRTGLGGERSEDAVEDVQPAPADEAIVERLVGALGRRRVAPLKAMANDIDDAADYTAIIHAWHTVRKRKVRR
jgi:hypothetical protein